MAVSHFEISGAVKPQHFWVVQTCSLIMGYSVLAAVKLSQWMAELFAGEMAYCHDPEMK
jgi:hypothetical protein